MSDQQRKAHLVGSMPFDNEEAAMTIALDKLGDCLITLPDGEIGAKTEEYPLGFRAAWTQAIVDVCEADKANFTVVRPAKRSTESGFPVSYDAEPKVTPKHPPSTIHNYLDFKWLDYFQHSYPLFKNLREERGRPDLKFQVGLPTGIGVTFPMMSPINALRYAGAFNKRMAFEANEMIKIADPGDLVFQLEVPGELALAYRLPDFLVGIALRTVIGLVEQIDSSATFGVHLCFGDLNNEALIKGVSLDKLVNFANGMIDRWPVSHKLDYVHFPLAEAAAPPPLEASYYEPLKHVNLPPNTRFVAGFIHDKRTAAENLQILQLIENLRGHKVDVASSCGLGRQTADVATQLIEMSDRLAKIS